MNRSDANKPKRTVRQHVDRTCRADRSTQIENAEERSTRKRSRSYSKANGPRWATLPQRPLNAYATRATRDEATNSIPSSESTRPTKEPMKIRGAARLPKLRHRSHVPPGSRRQRIARGRGCLESAGCFLETPPGPADHPHARSRLAREEPPYICTTSDCHGQPSTLTTRESNRGSPSGWTTSSRMLLLGKWWITTGIAQFPGESLCFVALMSVLSKQSRGKASEPSRRLARWYLRKESRALRFAHCQLTTQLVGLFGNSVSAERSKWVTTETELGTLMQKPPTLLLQLSGFRERHSESVLLSQLTALRMETQLSSSELPYLPEIRNKLGQRKQVGVLAHTAPHDAQLSIRG